MIQVSVPQRSSLSDLAKPNISSAKCFLPSLTSWLSLGSCQHPYPWPYTWRLVDRGSPCLAWLMDLRALLRSSNWRLGKQFLFCWVCQVAWSDWVDTPRQQLLTSRKRTMLFRRKERERQKQKSNLPWFLVPAPSARSYKTSSYLNVLA